MYEDLNAKTNYTDTVREFVLRFRHGSDSNFHFNNAVNTLFTSTLNTGNDSQEICRAVVEMFWFE